MRHSQRWWIAFTAAISLLGATTLGLAKAGSAYLGERGTSQSGSRTFEPNAFKPIDQSTALPGPTAAGVRRATGPVAPPAAGATAPVAPPSFFHRNPVLSGNSGIFVGSWISHMFFGATSAPAAVHDGGGDLVRQGDGTLSGSSWPFAGFLLIMLALLAGGIYYLSKRRNAHLSSAFAGLGGASPSRSEPPAWVPPSVGVLSPMSSPESKLTVHDEEKFRRLLVEIQTAWSRQDDRRLRRITTPEMFQYFSDKLTENVSAGVENRVEDVVVTGAEVRESWAEDGRLYATVLMQWKARDRVRSFANPSNDPDYEKKSDDRVSREYVEAWTFVKLREGTWLLSAIQQPE